MWTMQASSDLPAYRLHASLQALLGTTNIDILECDYCEAKYHDHDISNLVVSITVYTCV